MKKWKTMLGHVFTRLNLVPNVTDLDRQNQVYAFNDITTRIF
ncbi:MAG TPA: hypothetical protein VGP55_01060 [Chitinophagaceae bacterium]|nr:hypothetical protein [Chitinophagaceae bacterium]